MSSALARRTLLPGFGLSLGFTVAYLGLIVLLPLSAVLAKAARNHVGRPSGTRVSSPRVLAA